MKKTKTQPEPPETAPEKEQEIASLENEAVEADVEVVSDEKAKQYDELLDRYQRTLAEFDNFRKRTGKEKATLYDDGVKDTVEKLLPVVDNFERALLSVEASEDKFYQGIAMIARQISTFLNDIGVEVIATCGESFNHNVHYAVAHVEDEQFGANTVIAELQRGYKYKDKVIRPSMVKVAN